MVNKGYHGVNGKVSGYFTGCDMVPGFYEELRATGNDLDMDIFKPTEQVFDHSSTSTTTFGATS